MLLYKFSHSNSDNKYTNRLKIHPVIYIKSLSEITGYNIYAKLDYLSKYTSKDRIIRRILFEGKKNGSITKDTIIYENSLGLSGYSTSSICQELGYNCTIIVPDSCPNSLKLKIKNTKANLIITKNVDFGNFTDNYIRKCKRLSSQDNNGFYLNLYQNQLNYITHFEETGPELYNQLNQKIDAFICTADTGGTISGVSNYLKIKNKKCFVALADIEGSEKYTYIKEGVLFKKESGNNENNVMNINKGNCFLNNNLRKANIDDCYLSTFDEAMFIIDYVKKNDGINIGFNEGICLICILKLIKDKNNKIPKKSNIATIFSDDGTYDYDFIKNYNFENNPIKDINQIS